MLSYAFRLGLAAWLAASAVQAQSGYDSAGDPIQLVERLGLEQPSRHAPLGAWLRLRGFSHAPLGDANGAAVQELRDALAKLRDAGYRPVAFLRWDPKTWNSGGRAAGGYGNRAPLDLREAFERARAFAETYGDLVEAWEFENEPDIDYFADNADVVAAYYKAVALGIAAGRERIAARSAVEGLKVEGRRSSPAPPGTESEVEPSQVGRSKVAGRQRAAGRRMGSISGQTEGSAYSRKRDSGRAVATFDLGRGTLDGLAASLIVMPAMALPPGPYLEQLLHNGFLSYTEGVNLHFYGFAEDYGAAHDRLREALAEQRARSEEQGAGGGDGKVKGPKVESLNVESTRRGPRYHGKTWSGLGGGGDLGPALLDSGRFGSQARRFPVFVTEWGYPRLDGYDAQTVEGRVLQWRYFRAGQLENRRRVVAAPMAFYLAPYFEIGAKEFGLPMPPAERRAAHYGFAVDSPAGRVEPGVEGSNVEGLRSSDARREARGGLIVGANSSASESSSSGVFQAGGLAFAPADFGAKESEPWMRHIGETIGGGEASPALAWLMEDGARSRERGAGSGEPRTERAGHFRSPAQGHPSPAWRGDWLLHVEAPSPVVLDFVAGEGTRAVKNFNGYLLSGPRVGDAVQGRRSGRGMLVLYNFGGTEAEVVLPWSRGIQAESEATGEGEGEAARLILAPGERRELAVRLNVEETEFAAQALALAAEVRSGSERTVSRWATRLYPTPQGLRAAGGRSFFYPAEAARKNRHRLETRPHAAEELPLHARPDGRWRATEGVTVEETATGWRFHVSALPGAYLSPAVVELPLPDDWTPWERGLVFGYDYRVAPASFALRTPLRPDAPDARRRRQVAAGIGDMIESYLRTETGALYSTVPRLFPKPEWQRYNQPAETLTAFFPGRLKAPLRVEKERPAALVFYLRPIGLPTTFEIERPTLTHWRAVGPEG